LSKVFNKIQFKKSLRNY